MTDFLLFIHLSFLQLTSFGSLFSLSSSLSLSSLLSLTSIFSISSSHMKSLINRTFSVSFIDLSGFDDTSGRVANDVHDFSFLVLFDITRSRSVFQDDQF